VEVKQVKKNTDVSKIKAQVMLRDVSDWANVDMKMHGHN
jgi:hypothetical protein